MCRLSDPTSRRISDRNSRRLSDPTSRRISDRNSRRLSDRNPRRLACVLHLFFLCGCTVDSDEALTHDAGRSDASTPDAQAEGGQDGGASCLVSLRVVTYNIKHGRYSDHADPVTEDDLLHIATILENTQADLIALQEVDEGTARSSGVLQSAALAAALEMDVVFAPGLVSYDGGQYGNAVLSRFPILDTSVDFLPASPEQRSIACATVAADTPPLCSPLQICSTHLSLDEPARLAQISAISAIVGDAPVLLAGDFNATPGSATLNALETRWTSSIADVEAWTFPNDSTEPASLPSKQIDFIVHDNDSRWSLAAWEVVNNANTQQSSDHFPLQLDLVLQAP